MTTTLNNVHIAVIGIGYVGLPLAVEFARKYPTVGFDLNRKRVAELREGIESTLEVEPNDLARSNSFHFSCDPEDIRHATVYIVAVPTPVDEHKLPDLTPLKLASQTLAQVIKRGDVLVFESTVYPGATEEYCVPIIEHASGLKYNEDFFVGYSPERINPGDKDHRLTSIIKVTSGSNADTADFVDALYSSIIPAGTFKASSIKVAEAAKVIENTQRDLNIALMNELSIIFNKLGIDTEEVLEAAATKWNFLPFRPGLVGGHCIGVDPYYLTHKAESIGYHPQVILAGRRINDGMGSHIVGQLVKHMLKRRIQVDDANVLVMGLSFKENCPDIRNTRVIDIINELRDYNALVDVYDPWVCRETVQREYGISLTRDPECGRYDAIIIAVAHREFRSLGAKRIHSFGKPEHVLYDLKHVLSKEASDIRL